MKKKYFPPGNRPPKEWLRITIEVSPLMTDAAAGFLNELTNNGVEISLLSEDSTPIVDHIIGYLYEDNSSSHHDKLKQLRTFLTELRQYFPDEGEPVFYTDSILEEDWGCTWKRFFKTLRITPRLVIKPSWESYEPSLNAAVEEEVVIEMDPGLSFGTGHHDSTRMIMITIDDLFAKKNSLPKAVLDIGTGTGILAMSSALLGASRVLAIDNDPDALAAAKKNIINNDLEGIVTISEKDISTIQAQFDLITANIVYDVLRDLAPKLACMLNQGGKLVVSGLLKGDQERSIIAIYEKWGLILIESKYSEEWVAMVFSKNV